MVAAIAVCIFERQGERVWSLAIKKRSHNFGDHGPLFRLLGLLEAQAMQQVSAVKRLSLVSSHKLCVRHIRGIVVASKIELLCGWTHMSAEFQVTQHPVSNMMKLLRRRAMIDAAGKVLQIPGRLP